MTSESNEEKDKNCVPDGGRVLKRITPLDRGPLMNLDNDTVTSSFRSATYLIIACDKPVTLYRLHGGNAKADGQYWSHHKPEVTTGDNLSYRIDCAVQPNWNSLTEMATLTVPAGTILYSYYAAPNSEKMRLLGGGIQAFIPYDTLKEVINYSNNPTKANAEAILQSQKKILDPWERENHRMTDKAGLPLTSVARVNESTKNSVKALPLQITSYPSAILSPNSTECKQQLRRIECSPPTDRAREARVRSERSLRADFCSSNGITREQRFISAPWPGGVELVRRPPICDADGQTINSIASVSMVGDQLWVKPKRFGFKVYKLRLPEQLSGDELRCLQTACHETTKRGLMISVEIARDGMNVTTDGIDHNCPGAKDVYDTIMEADCLLGSLIFGFDVMTNTKTASPVQSYENPHDVQYRLLRTRNTVTGNESMKAQADARKFSEIHQQPKFIMNENVKLMVTRDGRVECSENALDIALRGIYRDPYANVYYDDNGQRCYHNHAFIRDFVKHYKLYLKEYKVLRKLDTYAIVIGILLNYSQTFESKRRETHKKWNIQRLLPAESEELKKVKQDVCRMRELLVEDVQTECDKASILLSLANCWLEYDRPHARDLAQVVLIELAAGHYANNSEFMRDVLIRDACMIFILTLVAEENNNSPDRLLTRDESTAFKELFGIKYLPNPSFCSVEDAIGMRAIEIALQISLKLESWDELFTLIYGLKSIITNIQKLNGVSDGKDSDEKLLWSELSKQNGEFPEMRKIIRDLSLKYILNTAKPALVNANDHKNWNTLTTFLTETNASSDESSSNEVIWFSALGYQLLFKGWLAQLDGNNGKDEQIAPKINDCYLQFTFLMRSFAAAFHCASTNESEKCRMLWVAWFAVDQITEIVNLLRWLQQRVQLKTMFESLQKEYKQLYEMTGMSSRSRQQSFDVLQLAYDTRQLAEALQDKHVVSETAIAMAYAYERIGDANNKALWERTSVTDRIQEKKQ